MKLYDSTIKNGFFDVPLMPATAALRIKFGKKYAPDAKVKEEGIKAKNLIQKCIDKDDIGKDISTPEALNALVLKGIEKGLITTDELIEMNSSGLDNIKSSDDIEKDTYDTLELFKAIINVNQIKDDKITALINSEVKSDFWLSQDLEGIEKELNSFRIKFSL